MVEQHFLRDGIMVKLTNLRLSRDAMALAVVSLMIVSAWLVWQPWDHAVPATPSNSAAWVANHVAYTTQAYPPGKLGEIVRLGETLVNETNEHPLTKPFIGNVLKCTSCHLDGGRHEQAGSFIGVAAAYPAYSPREQGVITLEDRILNCFIRSQNGTRPANGSEVPVAIAAYITWLSQGTPLKMNPEKPLGPNHMTLLSDPPQPASIERGESIYLDRCADCHSEDGLGTEEGPPVWGDQSFNDGAGLAGVPKLASWLKVAMPLDDTDLSDQEAFDVAAYMNSHERPNFEPK